MSGGNKGSLGKFGNVLRHPRKYIFTIVLAAILFVVAGYSYRMTHPRGSLDYKENLETEIVVVNGNSLTLNDLAFYVMYEEREMQKQAEVYDSENPTKYWNLHTDGIFIKDAAKDACMEMAIHDEIFYTMAQAKGIELTDEERKYLANSQMDFWLDMCEYDKQEKIGVSKQVIYMSMEKVAIAEKCQELYAAINGATVNGFNFDGDAYQNFLLDNEYKINKKVWDRVNLGSITVNN